jgi:hypothetical protein
VSLGKLTQRIRWALREDPQVEAIVAVSLHADGFRGPMAFCWLPQHLRA